MSIAYATRNMHTPQISRITRVMVIGLAIVMVFHFVFACFCWTLLTYAVVRPPHMRIPDLPQHVAQMATAWVLLSLSIWSAWSAWTWRRLAVRLLLVGLIGMITLIVIERRFSLYQLGVRSADYGEYAVYCNSWEVRGTRDRY